MSISERGVRRERAYFTRRGFSRRIDHLKRERYQVNTFFDEGRREVAELHGPNGEKIEVAYETAINRVMSVLEAFVDWVWDY